MEMKNEFFYEFNCIEDGEWVPEKQTFEDRLVMDLRFIWNHRYNLERRYSQQHLRSDAARWRFKRLQKESRKRLIRKLRAYRSNREFAPGYSSRFGKMVSAKPTKNVWILLISLNGY